VFIHPHPVENYSFLPQRFLPHASSPPPRPHPLPTSFAAAKRVIGTSIGEWPRQEIIGKLNEEPPGGPILPLPVASCAHRLSPIKSFRRSLQPRRAASAYEPEDAQELRALTRALQPLLQPQLSRRSSDSPPVSSSVTRNMGEKSPSRTTWTVGWARKLLASPSSGRIHHK